MVVADLHVHTDASDGSVDLASIPTLARDAGLRAVAVTDHDRPHPDLEAPVVHRSGVTIVHGIELRVRAPGVGRFDLLGYGLHRTRDLQRTVGRIQRNRIERARTMVECIEDREGIDLDVAFEQGVGRPHVARAVATHPDLDLSFQDAFDRLIGYDRPCFVPREVPSFERGVAVLKDACRLVGMAHPMRYREPAMALDLAGTLDAVERWYPYDAPVDPSPVDRAIRERGLIPTGGSDAHDGDLGRAGVEEEAFERFLAAADLQEAEG